MAGGSRHFQQLTRRPPTARVTCAGQTAGMELSQLQATIEATFGERDRARGVPASVAWLAEEVGELAQAIRKGTPEQQALEFADVLAWVATLANQKGIDLAAAVERYAHGCPVCHRIPCGCPLVLG